MVKVKTVDTYQLWQSPDGQKTIWRVGIMLDDKQYTVKTYSAAIATLGFEGNVESYVNLQGDRFVRQVIKKAEEA